MNTTAIPRACLVVPASDQRKIDKALAFDVDEIVLDLEDAVVPEAKDDARARVCGILGGPLTKGSVSVRINDVDSRWCHQDVLDVVAAAVTPVTLVVPKVNSAEDIAYVQRLVHAAIAQRHSAGESVPSIQLDALIETAKGLQECGAIAARSALLRALVIGYADLAADLGMDAGPDPAMWDPVRTAVVTSARAAKRAVIDGPRLSIDADNDFVADKERARRLGFDGSWVIHPGQIKVAADVFTPREAQVTWAEDVLAATRNAASDGRGAVALKGQMLDEAVVRQARNVVARAALGASR